MMFVNFFNMKLKADEDVTLSNQVLKLEELEAA